jgi:hypothetical protein
MNGFDEAWFQEHRAKMADYRQPRAVSIEPPSLIMFTLAKPTLLLNQVLRMHWTKQREYKRALSTEIARQLPDDPYRKPFEKATVMIRRFSAGVPDEDNLIGGVKHLVDCPLVRSGRHPWGLGLIRDDARLCLTLNVEAEKVRRTEQRTVVVVSEVEG